MITSTLDPISLNDVTDTENAPYVIEGKGDSALKIYFESEANKQEYLAIPMHSSDGMSGLNRIYDDMADNPDTGSINQQPGFSMTYRDTRRPIAGPGGRDSRKIHASVPSEPDMPGGSFFTRH